MNESRSDEDTTHGTGVRPWQTLSSLGLTENEVTAVHLTPATALRFLSGLGGTRHGDGAVAGPR
ncbi:hypothetical protein ACL07V_00435 [Streptomyces sp. MB22_4]|uniref:hypothetical protein n=1 Tax=Streptomyces sp. MB22_4 TaxID=3383120 RepID=UPI00399F6C95